MDLKLLRIAYFKMYKDPSRIIKTDGRHTQKAKAKVAIKNIANLKTVEIFTGIFNRFIELWKIETPTNGKIQSFIKKNSNIIATASIKYPALWAALSYQIRHNPKCPLSVKVKLLKCDDKLLRLMGKKKDKKIRFSHLDALSPDLKHFTIGKMAYKSIEELSDNITKIFKGKGFEKLSQFCNWMDREKIPIQWLLFLDKTHQLPFPSKKWMPVVKCLHLGRPLKDRGDVEKNYEDLAEAAQKMKSVVEFNFDMAGGVPNEKFLTPFAKDHGNKLKTVRFFITEAWWLKDEAKPLEGGLLGVNNRIKDMKKRNGEYVPFISSLTNVETFSMSDFPMGPLVLDALPSCLKRLTISNCALNDKELFSLKRLKNLERLNLEFCPNVTAAGIQALKLELPNLQIVYPR